MNFSADNENQGAAISLVYKDEHGNFKSNLAEVEKVLLNPKIKDLKVAVVSIAGKYRRGKSFLLNFFLRYLNSKAVGKEGDWIGSENEELEGFSWKLQSGRVTTGILVWSNIFVTEVNNEKIAIVLMDTQGTFDDDHIMMDHTKIFAMVTLLSSFEIYNVMRDIEEDDLQVLAMFTQYAEQVHNMTDVKMGQNLQFLVRDWGYPYEFPFGSEGGQLNLMKKMSTANRNSEFVRVREALQSSYEHTSCYLMPHPGLEIISNPNSKGQISVMDKKFVEYLKEYVPLVFSQENLKIKQFNGRPITVADLVHYIRSYEQILTTKCKQESLNLFEIHVHATFDLAKKEATDMYNKEMTKDYDRCNSTNDLNDIHMVHFKAAMNHFNETNIKGSEDIRKMYITKLEEDITSFYESRKCQMIQYLDEMKRRQEEERKRIEEERRRMEAERNRIEEERRRIEAESNKAEEERKRIEAERQLREEESKRQETERLLREEEMRRKKAEKKSKKKGVCARVLGVGGSFIGELVIGGPSGMIIGVASGKAIDKVLK